MSAIPEGLDVRDLLNAQTGRVQWQEVQKLFAQGLLLHVSTDLDLVEVAAQVVDNDKQQIENRLAEGSVSRVDTEQAKRWHACNQEFWAVVAAPWVFIQEA